MTDKTILCIRHGESTFNAAYAAEGKDPMLFDAPLTERGHQQVEDARRLVRDLPIDVVLTTPLTRALQTTLGLFSDHPSRPEIIIEPMHRERLESSCDRGRSPAELKLEFPHLGLDHLPDTWWHAQGEPDERGIHVEPLDTLLARMIDFAKALESRTEATVAVVGHCTFFYHLTGRMLHNCEIYAWDGTIPEQSPIR